MSYHTIDYERNFGLAVFYNDHVPGMVGFSFEFLNSDHHLGELTIGDFTYDDDGNRSPGSYLVGYSDLDFTGGSDPVRISCPYYDLAALGFDSDFPALEVTGSGRSNGRLILPIPDLSNNELVFLRGFSLGTPRDKNHHIRAIGIRFQASTRSFIIDFKDNSPEDDSFNARIFYYKVPKAPENYTGNDLVFHTPVTVTSRFRKSAVLSKNAVQGITFLSGFYFEFEDGDHHIEKIAVNLQDIRRIALAFHDQGNPPAYAEVQYTELSSYAPE